MNIIEAIKSGLPFRRKDWKYAAFITPRKNGVGMQLLEIDYDSICADDWEVEEVSCYAGCVTITREQFDAAWSKLWPYDAYNDSLNSINCYTKLERDALAKELGL